MYHIYGWNWCNWYIYKIFIKYKKRTENIKIYFLIIFFLYFFTGGRRFSEGTSADREIQRTLMELLNQMDGFDSLGQVKMIMATNRPDTLDPALLRPGRLDRKIEIPLPNEQARLEILKIHAGPISKHGEIGKIFYFCLIFSF